MIHYFADDGNYGDATEILIVHTDHWSEQDWDSVESAPDGHRQFVAQSITEKYRKTGRAQLTLGL
jgi:hypothetical protein